MYEGVLNVYKEKGFTSHDVVAKLRGILKMKQIGHTGTLDPDAEGVLPVCLGQATKLCDFLTDWDKVYRTVMLLGVETDTQDITGRVLRTQKVMCGLAGGGEAPGEAAGAVPGAVSDGIAGAVPGVVSDEVVESTREMISDGAAVPETGKEVLGEAAVLGTDGRIFHITEKHLTETILHFVGGYDQIPPMYSARKVGGKKLYELARQGKSVERQARPVTIHQIQVERVEIPRVAMTVACSKGTYIRTLCHDIGRELGCGACMESLLRVRVGRFCAEESLRLSQIEKLRDEGELEGRIVPIEEMFSEYPKVYAFPQADRMAHNGNPLGLGQVRLKIEGNASAADGAEYVLYDSEGTFLGIYTYEQGKSRFKPRKLFLARNGS